MSIQSQRWKKRTSILLLVGPMALDNITVCQKMEPRGKCSYCKKFHPRQERENYPVIFLFLPSSTLALIFPAPTRKQSGKDSVQFFVLWYTKVSRGIGIDLRANRQMISTGPNDLYVQASLFSDDNRHFQKERVRISKVTLIKCLPSIIHVPSTSSISL